jgi:hypothetical protein
VLSTHVWGRNLDPHPAALPDVTVDGNAPGVTVNNPLSNRQAEAGTAGLARAGRVRPIETIEHAGHILGGDPDPSGSSRTQ